MKAAPCEHSSTTSSTVPDAIPAGGNSQREKHHTKISFEREKTQRNDKMMHTCTDAGEGRVGLPCLREDGALFQMSVKG